MKILISGAGGFIGSHLLSRLVNLDHEIFALTRPGTVIQNGRATKIECPKRVDGFIELMQATPFDGVVHLASRYLSQHSSGDFEDLIESNVAFPARLMESASLSGVKWFLNTGTYWQHYQDAVYAPVNLYAATKQAFDDLARFYWSTSDLKVATLKLSDTFGPGDPRKKLFSLWKDSQIHGENLSMSAGDQIIDLSYISDVIDAYVQMMSLLQERPEMVNGQSFGLTPSTRVTLRELAKVFEEVSGKPLKIDWGARPYRTREVMVPWTQAVPVPGWQPKMGLRDGIQCLLQ